MKLTKEQTRALAVTLCQQVHQQRNQERKDFFVKTRASATKRAKEICTEIKTIDPEVIRAIREDRDEKSLIDVLQERAWAQEIADKVIPYISDVENLLILEGIENKSLETLTKAVLKKLQG